MKVIVDHKIPYIEEAIRRVADEVVFLPGHAFTPEVVKDADALIVRTRTHCNRALLQGSKVKFIATATIGFDHIDTQYCEEAGIIWKNSPGCNAVSVAQYVFAGLLTIALQKKEHLSEKTIGIVGVGHVGKEIEKLCKAYGMKVLRNDPPRAEIEGETDFVSLNTIAEQADIITLRYFLLKAQVYIYLYCAR